MLYNNNLKVSWALVRRDFRFHRAKNALLVLAAALVTALYTFVFLLGNAVQSGFLLSYQYLYGSTSHILYTGLTESQAALLSQHVNVKSAVTLSTIGTLSDPVLGQRTVQLAVTDRDYAETVLSLPSEGRLPEESYEIALDEYTMGSLGLPYELGTAFPLQWTDAAGETHTDTFTLCGWWMSAANFTEACAWITADTASALFPGYDGETVELEGQTFTVMGSLMHDNAYLSGQNSREASFTFYYILPLSAFDVLYPDSPVRQMAINIDPAGQGSFEAFLSDFESGLNRGIGVTLRSDYQRNFRDASLNTVLVPLIIGLVLAGIALLGFVNLLITRSVSRKRAFAVFQSLGMTIAQLRQLILLEGVLYALIMAAVLVPVSVAAAVIVMPGVIAELSWISVYEFTLLPLWVLLPVILILSVAVPLACV